jgi:hypothetical protein
MNLLADANPGGGLPELAQLSADASDEKRCGLDHADATYV